MRQAIIDTDMGVDDALALLLAFGSGHLEIEAITTVCGNVPVGRATANLAIVMELLRPRRRPPLAQGAEAPLVYPLETATSVHGEDGLGGASRLRDDEGKLLYPPPEGAIPRGSAVSTILETIRRHPGEITLITLGPLTNVACAIVTDRSTMAELKELVIMGGAFRVPGNVSPCAEFNIFVDPHAAALALDLGVPTLMVPLDATHQVLLTREDVKALRRNAAGPISHFVHDVTARYIEFHRTRNGQDGCYLHDPLAVAVAYDRSLVRAEPLTVGIETEAHLTRGMTVGDFRSHQEQTPGHVSVCLDVDRHRFQQHFLETLASLRTE